MSPRTRTLKVRSVPVPDDHRTLAYWALRTFNLGYREIAEDTGLSTTYIRMVLDGRRNSSPRVRGAVSRRLAGQFTEAELWDREVAGR
jgi:hypothetical protein